MPAIETSIWLALKGRVASLVLSPSLPVAYPNESFSPPVSGYLRVTHMPNTNRRLFIGSTDPHQRQGLLQVDVFAKVNQPAAVATEIAGQVAAWFAADLELYSNGIRVRVTKYPDIAPAMHDEPFWMLPVTVTYEVFA